MWSSLKKIIISFAITFVVWQLISLSGLVNPMFLPSPLETSVEGIRLLLDKKIFIDIAYTFYRILYGTLLAILTGVPVGLLLGHYEKAYKCVECIIDFFRSIPPILTFPLSLLIFGIGEGSRIAVIFFGCFLIVVLNSALGVIHSPKMRVHIAKIMGAKRGQIIFKVVFFNALPQIFVGLRMALSLGIIVGLVTEMLVGAKYGLGSRIIYAQTSYATPEMYFIIILVGIIGFSLNKLIIMVEKKVVHWNN